jgi:hypothetical protein
MELAKQFFEGVELIQCSLEVMDGIKHNVKFDTDGDGLWSVKFYPEGRDSNT